MERTSIGTSRVQLSEEVAAYLRGAIIAGEIGAGESIRAEAIGEMLSVSATPVREALYALRAEGFLELAPRRGFNVAPLVAQDIRDIFLAHALVAGELAARAAVNANKADIAALEAIHRELMDHATQGDADALERSNHLFHRTLYRVAGSSRLLWALSVFTKYVPRSFYSQIEGWPDATSEDHAEVLRAIAAGDADAARSAMQRHIQNAGELLAVHHERRSAR